jgi:hypothetical protein
MARHARRPDPVVGEPRPHLEALCKGDWNAAAHQLRTDEIG